MSKISDLALRYKRPGIRWRIWPNPMRPDGVFVGEDKVVEPYPDVKDLFGKPIYPALPVTDNKIPFQLSHEEAKELVNLLNEP